MLWRELGQNRARNGLGTLLDVPRQFLKNEKKQPGNHDVATENILLYVSLIREEAWVSLPSVGVAAMRVGMKAIEESLQDGKTPLAARRKNEGQKIESCFRMSRPISRCNVKNKRIKRAVNRLIRSQNAWCTEETYLI